MNRRNLVKTVLAAALIPFAWSVPAQSSPAVVEDTIETASLFPGDHEDLKVGDSISIDECHYRVTKTFEVETGQVVAYVPYFGVLK